MLAACVTGCGNLLINVGPMANGCLRPEELANLQAFGPWMKIYGESIYGTQGGPYINGEWGGCTSKGNTLYLHIFKRDDGGLKLPALHRKVLSCCELGGESVSCIQTADLLVLKLAGDRTTELHSVVKIDLEAGAPIPLMPMGKELTEILPRLQPGALENPMGSEMPVCLG